MMRLSWVFGIVVLLLIFPATATAVHSSGVDDTGLMALWAFDEVDGPLRDVSGNGFNGSVYGNPDRGVLGVNNSSAYRFDGEDDRIVIDDPEDRLEPREEVTLVAWIRPSTINPPDVARIVEGSNIATFELLVLDDGRLAFVVDTRDDGGDWMKATYDLPEPDRWYHAVGTYNGSLMKLYVDGELVGTVEQSGLINEQASSDPIIGSEADSVQFYEGLLDEMRVYNRTLSADEIDWLFANPPGWHPGTGESQDDAGQNDTANGDNETSTDDETGMDNETSGDDTTEGQMENETDDGSLFTGGNGTDDGSFDDGSTNGTSGMSNETSWENETVNGSTTYENDTVGGDEQTIGNGSTEITIRPDRMDIIASTGDTVRRQILVENTGTEQVEVDIRSVGLDMSIIEPATVVLGPGEQELVTAGFVLADVSEGEYSGVVRAVIPGTAYSIPVRLRVTEQDGRRSNVSMTVHIDEEGRLIGGREYMYSEIRSGGELTNATVISKVVSSDGEIQHDSRFSASVSPDDPYSFTTPLDLPPGEYRWNISVVSPAGTTWSTQTFTIEGDVAEERDDGRQRGTSFVPVLLVLLILAGVGMLFRERIVRSVGRFADRIGG